MTKVFLKNNRHIVAHEWKNPVKHNLRDGCDNTIQTSEMNKQGSYRHFVLYTCQIVRRSIFTEPGQNPWFTLKSLRKVCVTLRQIKPPLCQCLPQNARQLSSLSKLSVYLHPFIYFTTEPLLKKTSSSRCKTTHYKIISFEVVTPFQIFAWRV
jgi:hypothetical protein